MPFWLYVVLSVPVCWAHNRELSEWVHEASHYNLVDNRKWNDLLANVLASWWMGFSILTYRRSHLRHHAVKRFFNDGDPDTIHFIVRSRKELRRALLRDITGVSALANYLTVVFGLNKSEHDLKHKKPDIRATVLGLSPLVIVHLSVLSGLIWIGRFDAYVIYYAVLVSLYSLMNRLRLYGQHAEWMPDGSVRLIDSEASRTTDGGFIDRIFFTSKLMLYHCEHHARPNMPWRGLVAMCQANGEINSYTKSRWKLVFQLYRSLPA